MEILAIIGVVAFAIGWAWLAITAFQKGNYIWGISVILFGPIAGLAFCIVKKTGWIPLALYVVGMIISSIGLSPMLIKQIEFLPK